MGKASKGRISASFEFQYGIKASLSVWARDSGLQGRVERLCMCTQRAAIAVANLLLPCLE